MNEEKIKLYQLILAQLNKDGFARAAELLSDTALIPLEKKIKLDAGEPDLEAIVHHHHLTYVPPRGGSLNRSFNEQELYSQSSIDLQSGTRSRTPAMNIRSKNKVSGGARCGAFDFEGSTFAAGSGGGGIKILEAASAFQDGAEDAPVLKTLLDHTEPVTGLRFHPRAKVLISASKDKTIRMFAYSSMSTTSFEAITDTHPVKSIALHPSGDFILAACQHPYARLYVTDEPQAAPLISSTAQHHTAPINDISWARNGSVYCTASADGSVKIWDAVSSKVAKTVSGAHGGAPVNSVMLSHNSNYLLTAGNDSTARIFDVRMGALLRIFKGMSCAKNKIKASFLGPMDEYVIGGTEETGNPVFLFDTATASLAHRISGNNSVVTACVPHPGTPLSFVSCAKDGQLTFYRE